MYSHIVFDRDGTLIEFVNYLSAPNKVSLVMGVVEVFKELKKRKIKLFLHTNQSGVARGYFTIDDVHKCNNRMLDLIGLGYDVFEDICIATDLKVSNITYRKPSSLFGKEILNKYQINKTDLLYVGDTITDLETAKNIGCDAFGVNYGKYDLSEKLKSRQDLSYKVFNSFTQIGKEILLK